MPPEDRARARAAEVARASYGRLVAILSARGSDIAAAEDALSDAFQAALTRWPRDGVPESPEAWLVRVARNRMTDAHRRALRQHPVPIEEHALAMPASDASASDDPRLGLLFACAHPGIAEAARAPLMLQAVLGFTAAEIARAYVRSPEAIAKQLGRAKLRIKANAIPFRVPDPEARPARLADVTEAIYGCYALVWTDGPEAGAMQREAVFLADLLATTLPDDAEVLGLSALLGLLHARRAARLRDGVYVPLDRQETALWDHGLASASEDRLRRAFRLGRPGRFQIEAAIQSVHAARARSGSTDWAALVPLYQGLLALAPTLGALVGQAAVIGKATGPEAGLAALDRLDGDTRLARFQPFWACRAHLLARAGRHSEARDAFARAIALCVSAPQRDYLETARRDLPRDG